MMSRFALLLLLSVSAFSYSQTAASTDTHDPRVPKAFRDSSLGITYYYPGRYVPATPAVPAPPPAAVADKDKKDAATSQCVHSDLSADSSVTGDTSVFVLSTIGSACPGILQQAQDLSTFTREQVLRQLRRYGTPTITQEPTRYTIDGRPAVITIASAQEPDSGGTKLRPITYAAKACVLSDVPVDAPGKSSFIHGRPRALPSSHVVCFDFTTQQRDLLNLTLSFTIQFDGQAIQPLVPGTILH
jgi:hypothetical protein